MSTAKSGGFERTTVQPERVGVSKLVQPRNPFFIVRLRTKAKKHPLVSDLTSSVNCCYGYNSTCQPLFALNRLKKSRRLKNSIRPSCQQEQ